MSSHSYLGRVLDVACDVCGDGLPSCDYEVLQNTIHQYLTGWNSVKTWDAYYVLHQQPQMLIH